METSHGNTIGGNKVGRTVQKPCLVDMTLRPPSGLVLQVWSGNNRSHYQRLFRRGQTAFQGYRRRESGVHGAAEEDWTGPEWLLM